MAARLTAVVVAPLDAVRARVLRRVGRRVRGLLVDRTRRVHALVLLGVPAALVLALVAPAWTFALSPLVLGVPHLVSDVRYLVVRRGLHRRLGLATACGIPLAVSLFTSRPAIGLFASAGAVLFARSPRRARRVVLGLGVAAALALAHLHPAASAYAVVHGHNVLAVVLFACVFARARRVARWLLASTVGVAALLLAGAFDGAVVHVGAPATGLSLGAVAEVLAPFCRDPVLAQRVTLLFVFAQGVHYLVWLRLVPDDARERPGVRSFASSLDGLARDLGWPLLALSVLALLGLLGIAATSSLEVARLVYLRGAGFHAYLELAFAVVVLLEGRRASA